MISKPTLQGTAIFFSLLLCLFLTFSSCKKDAVNPVTKSIDTGSAYGSQIATAGYVWDELAINKTTESDAIKYDAVSGKIDSVLNYDVRGVLTTAIKFTYSGNKITLNTPYNDEYDLDSTGKVVYHSTQEVQQGHNITEIERYGYDANNYLDKITMSSNFDDYIGPVYSEIDYEVTNGNYTKYTLLNTDSGTITRQYVFTYNTAKTVKSPCAFFAPIFSDNTLSNIDKYLNYGKASVNLLTGISYTLRNLNYSTVTGSFTVITTVNSANYITSLNLAGITIPGFPSDNLSPLPRYFKFTLVNPAKN